MADSYIKDNLARRLGMKKSEIPQELIDLSKPLLDIKRHLREVKKMNPWINVKDKLPDHESIVLCSKGGTPRVSLFHLSPGSYLFLDIDCMSKQFIGITHWMMIPDAPEIKE